MATQVHMIDVLLLDHSEVLEAIELHLYLLLCSVTVLFVVGWIESHPQSVTATLTVSSLSSL